MKINLGFLVFVMSAMNTTFNLTIYSLQLPKINFKDLKVM